VGWGEWPRARDRRGRDHGGVLVSCRLRAGALPTRRRRE